VGRLEDKVALITGTGGGMSRAAAELFVREGAAVAGCDLKEEGAQETVAWVTAADGTMTSTRPLDLADEAAVRAWIDRAAHAHGGIDILYNNAGATRFDPIEEVSYEDWKFTLRNELDIVFLACKHAWSHLRPRGQEPAGGVGRGSRFYNHGLLTHLRYRHPPPRPRLGRPSACASGARRQYPKGWVPDPETRASITSVLSGVPLGLRSPASLEPIGQLLPRRRGTR
jgi:NAD(P)-dependent dehydrogenase (short-subunit alcohol dehydrogenase family)